MIPAVSQENTFAVPGIANTIAIRVLRSPLHGLLSHNTLLLSVQGRKSGKTNTIPLSYTQEGDTVLCFTRRGNTWWKNLREDTLVTVDPRDGACQAEPAQWQTIRRRSSARCTPFC